MITTALQQLGLSPNEAKIYGALLELKEAGVGKISSHTDIHRRNIYDAIKRLVDKGLVFPILSQGENVYSPVDPDKLLELVKEKEQILSEILPIMRNRYSAERRSQEAYIYCGIEGFKNYMRDILRVGDDAYFIGAKLGWFDPRLARFTEQFLKEARRKNLVFHHIFDASVQDSPLPETKNILSMVQKPYKFLPEKYATSAAIDIFGEYVVTFTGLSLMKLDEKVTLFVLRDKNLAESYRTWFEMIFEFLP